MSLFGHQIAELEKTVKLRELLEKSSEKDRKSDYIR